MRTVHTYIHKYMCISRDARNSHSRLNSTTAAEYFLALLSPQYQSINIRIRHTSSFNRNAYFYGIGLTQRTQRTNCRRPEPLIDAVLMEFVSTQKRAQLISYLIWHDADTAAWGRVSTTGIATAFSDQPVAINLNLSHGMDRKLIDLIISSDSTRRMSICCSS